MKIPAIRDRLYELAERVRLGHKLAETAKELVFLADATKRRPYVRRKYNRCGPSDTDKIKQAGVRRMMKIMHNAGMSYPEISKATGVHNLGRISEAVRGKAI